MVFNIGLVQNSQVSHLAGGRCWSFAAILGVVFGLLFSGMAAAEAKVSANAGKADEAQSVQKIYGAGPSTEIVTLFFEKFAQQPEGAGYQFQVQPRSTKHAGGIRASGRYLFGKTGRPLSEKEIAQGKAEIILGKVTAGFVTGKNVVLPELTATQIGDIFSGKVTNWKALGGPDAAIIRVGRESTESVMSVLKLSYPMLATVSYDHVFKRDHSVVNFLSSSAGSHAIGFGALANFEELNIVKVSGEEYGVPLGLVIDLKNKNHPLVQAVTRFANSDEWKQTVNQTKNHLALDTAKTDD